jgi:hypothetical protein
MLRHLAGKVTLLAAAFGLVATAAAGLTPASAAVRSAAHVTPDTKAVSCASSSVWVAIVDAAGESCYTGAGSLAVSLKDTTEAQVKGEYQVCLSGAATRCLAGPGVTGFDPPIDVTEIEMGAL